MKKNLNARNYIRNQMLILHQSGLDLKICIKDLRQCLDISNQKITTTLFYNVTPSRINLIVAFIFLILVFKLQLYNIVNDFIGARCLLANNYLIWEISRPISNCKFCEGVDRPIVLHNVTKSAFQKYVYNSQPIIAKGAIMHWQAGNIFNFSTFKKLYQETNGAYESVEEDCQFLNFKSDLFSLREVFEMPTSRAYNEAGEVPWYVGWGNCHPKIISFMRQYYDVPEFLPEDAEFPKVENIFFGYEMGAVMHLDYIPRLMWQGQVKGNKTWSIVPIPECENVCKSFNFYVEPGDVVLLDTRVWYHATRIPPGQFAVTIQSEYG